MAQLPHIDSSVRGDDHPRKWAAMAVLGAVAFMAQLDLFVVNVALPAMGDTYAGASLSALSWVLNAYTVVFAALLIPAGRLADHFGRRRFLVAGTIVFTVASGAMCGGAVANDPDRGPHRPGGGRRGHRPDLPWPSPAGLPGETTQYGGGTVGWLGRGRRDAGPDCRWAASRPGLAVDLPDQRADRAAHRGVRRPCGATPSRGYGIPSPGSGFDGVPVDGDHRVRPGYRRRPQLGMAHHPRLGAVCRCGRGYRAHCAAVGHPPARTDRSVSVLFPFLHGRDPGAVPVLHWLRGMGAHQCVASAGRLALQRTAHGVGHRAGAVRLAALVDQRRPVSARDSGGACRRSSVPRAWRARVPGGSRSHPANRITSRASCQAWCWRVVPRGWCRRRSSLPPATCRRSGRLRGARC